MGITVPAQFIDNAGIKGTVSFIDSASLVEAVRKEGVTQQ